MGEWGSHPDEDNDDQWYGDSYRTREQAMEEALRSPAADVFFVTFDGPDESFVRQVPRPHRSKPEPQCNEYAQQAGMLGGVHAYNDAVGSPCGEYEPW